MRNSVLIIMLVAVIGILFYYLGKKNGAEVNTAMVQNVALIKEIAELSALSVSGNTTIRISNKDNATGVFNKLKNYFSENTLQITLPFDAKYGVDMSNQKVEINTKDSIATIYLPECKLLSLQLRLDKLDAISKTGLFQNSTLDDFIAAQKRLYTDAEKSLVNDSNYKKLAEAHISFILAKYYAPMGLKVNCIFGGHSALKSLN